MSGVYLKDILPEFQAFLRDRRLASEKNIPYHALWASRYLRFAQNNTGKEEETAVLEFLERDTSIRRERRPATSRAHTLRSNAQKRPVKRTGLFV